MLGRLILDEDGQIISAGAITSNIVLSSDQVTSDNYISDTPCLNSSPHMKIVGSFEIQSNGYHEHKEASNKDAGIDEHCDAIELGTDPEECDISP